MYTHTHTHTHTHTYTFVGYLIATFLKSEVNTGFSDLSSQENRISRRVFVEKETVFEHVVQVCL